MLTSVCSTESIDPTSELNMICLNMCPNELNTSIALETYLLFNTANHHFVPHIFYLSYSQHLITLCLEERYFSSFLHRLSVIDTYNTWYSTCNYTDLLYLLIYLLWDFIKGSHVSTLLYDHKDRANQCFSPQYPYRFLITCSLASHVTELLIVKLCIKIIVKNYFFTNCIIVKIIT